MKDPTIIYVHVEIHPPADKFYLTYPDGSKYMDEAFDDWAEADEYLQELLEE